MQHIYTHVMMVRHWGLSSRQRDWEREIESIFSYIVYRLQYDCSCTSSVGVGMQSPLVRACMCKCFCESL